MTGTVSRLLAGFLSIATAVAYGQPAGGTADAAAGGGPTGTLILTPSSSAPEAGERVQLSAERLTGDRAMPQTWAGLPVHWHYVRVGGTQENRPSVLPDGPADAADAPKDVTLELKRAGVTMAGVDLEPWVEEVEAATLRAHLQGVVPTADLARVEPALARGGMIRVRRVESAKAFIGVGTVGKGPIDPQTATSKAGQRGEIRLLSDPWLITPGSDLPVRTYVDWDKKGHVRVIAERVGGAAGERISVEVDASGIGAVRIGEAGVWRILMHHARLSQDGEADIELHTASVVTPVGAKGAKEATR